MGHCKNCGRLSENHHTNERPTPEATRFEPTVGSGIMAVYGSGSSFRDKLSSYLPRKGVTKRPLDRPEYSIKPLAYVFPQFHPIPENDKFWGENFTEWDFVQKMDINKYGLDILLPTEEVGYYNLLDLSVRQRWTDTIRNSSIYGLVYHHYWFGYPVMPKVLEAILVDGHPDVPFMFNWANEPWTVRWDGLESANGDGTLLGQNYGGFEEWRRHFDWLAPFFRHKNYIRVNGKVQFQVYSPINAGDVGKKMFQAWRLWASQDPAIGALDIIEVALIGDNPNNRGYSDAISEFGVRSGGGLDVTAMPQTPRLSRVFYRGTLVRWDNTPRHRTDGAGEAVSFSHPALWKGSMIQLMSRIKSDPNPLGEENFVFINAFNEWGEGNAMEPSIRFGDGYLRALHDAMEYVEKYVPWAPHQVLDGSKIEEEVRNTRSQVDVCVIIREFHAVYPYQEPWSLLQTLESLRDLENKRWRAVIAGVRIDDEARRINLTVLETHDARIINAGVPVEVQKRPEDNPNGSEATDWVIQNLDEISPSCARATYMLITNATTRYEPDAFNGLNSSKADIVGLNFESRESMAFGGAGETEKFTWDQYCERYESGLLQTCMPSKVDSELLDLSAVFLNIRKWRQERIELAKSVNETGETGILRQLTQQASPWTWEPPTVEPSVSCHVLHAGALTTCNRTGRIWADLPEPYYDAGCYSAFGLQTRYGGRTIPDHYDWPRFDKHPHCVRLSEKQFGEALGTTT